VSYGWQTATIVCQLHQLWISVANSVEFWQPHPYFDPFWTHVVLISHGCSPLDFVVSALFFGPSSWFYYCGVWRVIMLVLALTFLWNMCGCWHRFEKSWKLATTGLCVTSLFALWQPHASVVGFLVYDAGRLWQGLAETIVTTIIQQTFFCLSLSMVRGHQVIPWGPKTSPWHCLFCPHCFDQQWIVSGLWLCLSLAPLLWIGLLMPTLDWKDYYFLGTVCTSAFVIESRVCQLASVITADHDCFHPFEAYSSLNQLRASRYNWNPVICLFGLNMYKPNWFYILVLYHVLIYFAFSILRLGGLYSYDQVLITTDPYGSFDLRLEVCHYLLVL